MPEHPLVYPSSVQYRPGRVQSLDPDQEILLKQAWAFLLHYWGYGLDVPIEDIESKHAFVASSVTALALHRSKTGHSLISEHKRKRSLFHRRKTQHEKPLSATRAKQLTRLHMEKYEHVESASAFIKHVYHSYEGAESEPDIDSDVSSVQTFYTAHSILSDNSGNTSVTDGNGKNQKGNSQQNLQTEQEKAGGKSEVDQISAYKVSPQRNIRPFMAKYDPQVLHSSFIAFSRNDLVDNLLLRYIRARKYVFNDAMQMLAKSLHWKAEEYRVNDMLMEGDAPAYIAGDTREVGFIKNFIVSKLFIRGQDRNKNPLFVFQSSKHFAADSPLPETEKFALVVIEWCRLFLREVHESVDTCSVMFDLTGFSMKNADNAPIKFLMAMFEAHYPESLGIVIVHNAPWIFQTVWSIIKNWLDPVVSSKIHFTKGYKDLCELIEPKYIPEYLGGEDKADLTYKPPSKEHTRPPKKKDAHYYELVARRHELFTTFLDVTKRWVESTNPEVSSHYLRRKIYLSYELSDNYIELDPYIRNPGVYDRDGTLVLRN